MILIQLFFLASVVAKENPNDYDQDYDAYDEDSWMDPHSPLTYKSTTTTKNPRNAIQCRKICRQVCETTPKPTTIPASKTGKKGKL